MKRKVKIGLIGMGTVGDKVLDLMCRNRSRLERKVGAGFDIAFVCDKNRSALRKIPGNCKARRTTNWKKVVNDPSVDIVVEVIGGHNPAKQIVMRSLNNSKHVVTANKAILSRDWEEIFTLAGRKQRLIYFEASVLSGVPVIQSLNEGLESSNISSISGIFNGTCNYILTKMTREGIDFKVALKDAQKAGLAEPDPRLDIEGDDTVHKLAILSSITWNAHVKPDRIYCEGINNLSRIDVKFAREEFGHRVKLLGVARWNDGELELYVRPCLVPDSHPFAWVNDENNAVMLDGDACGRMMFQGKGAGGYPAASAVVSDIMYLSRQVATGVAGKIPYVDYSPDNKIQYMDSSDFESCYYLRFTAVDKPGVLAKISSILGKHRVSIAGVYQKGPFGKLKKGVPILMFTHRVREGSVRDAMEEIDRLKIIVRNSILMKVEN